MRITDPKYIQRLIDKGLLNKGDLKDKSKKAPRIKENIALLAKSTYARNQGSVSSEDLLFDFLLPIFGDYHCGGELIKELVPLSDRRYRADIALPRYRTLVEIDGIQGHAQLSDGSLNKDGFIRDRTKDMLMITNGWGVVRCVRSQIKSEPELLVNAICSMAKWRGRREVNILFEEGKHPVVQESSVPFKEYTLGDFEQVSDEI